ncbi:hypothetical protein [Carboxylicivirga sediminis]|nr:hypothetical protein [Carboxylicivirga sediminis]
MTWQNLNALFEENYWLVQEQKKAYKKDEDKTESSSFSALAQIPGVKMK